LRGEEKRELGFGEGIVYTADLASLHRWIKSTATIALRVGLWPSAWPRPVGMKMGRENPVPTDTVSEIF